MDTKEQASTQELASIPEKQAKCLSVSKRGIKTGNDFAQYMSALMSDLVEGTVTPNVGNAACNAGGKLLKVVEMQHKYGTTSTGKPKTLMLTENE